MSIASFGVNEFAFRLPSAIASTLWVLVVFVFTRKILNTHIAWLAALFMATSMEIALIGKAATADATLNLFITASMLSLYQFLRTQHPKFLYITALCVGLGFLLRGRCFSNSRNGQFFALPDIGSVAAVVANSDQSYRLDLFTIVALPWYVLQYIAAGNEFLQGFSTS
ncbi:MAG: glycosyltransferase family 39 protein [Thiotrichaceae bacterium]